MRYVGLDLHFIERHLAFLFLFVFFFIIALMNLLHIEMEIKSVSMILGQEA